MATNTVPILAADDGVSGASGRTISAERLDLAAEALFEIGSICRVLREQIEDRPQSAEIKPLARGMLSRVERLSDAVHACVGLADDWDDDQLRQIVVEGAAT